MKQTINSNNAPQPIGPYSQAVKAKGAFVFISGQIPFTKDGDLVGDTIQEQTRQSIENIQAILNEENLSLKDVVKVNIYMKDLGQFVEMNEVYNSFFSETKPARAAVEVSRLPKDVQIEIEAIAVFED